MMGSPVAPVGIWYWRADRMNIEALIARGPGTLAKAQDETLGGRAFYRFNPDTEQGYWYLVVSKDLRQHAKNAVSFRRQTIPFAVALWQGDADQRDGLKRVSEWLTIDLSKLGKKP